MKKIDNYHDYVNTLQRLEIIGEMLENKNFSETLDHKKVLRDGLDSIQALQAYFEQMINNDQ